MLKNSPFYAGFAVDDVAKAREFYGETLSVQVIELGSDLLSLQGGNGYAVLIYPKDTHEPAAHTILNSRSTTSRRLSTSSEARGSSSSSTTRDRSQPTRRASRLLGRSRRGSRTRRATSCR